MRLPSGLALVALASLACSSSDGTATDQGSSGDITVGNNFFSPASLSVNVGQTVIWGWNPGGVDHNVTFDDGQHSPTQSSGTYQRAFPTAGSYAYHCTIHGASVMHGVVTVGQSGGGGGGGGSGGGGGPYGSQVPWAR